MKATEGRLICKVIKEEKKTKGGILLTKNINEDIHRGTVVSVGETKKDIKQTFEVGQTVVWANFSGVKFNNDGEEFIIINQSDIIAIDE